MLLIKSISIFSILSIESISVYPIYPLYPLYPLYLSLQRHLQLYAVGALPLGHLLYALVEMP